MNQSDAIKSGVRLLKGQANQDLRNQKSFPSDPKVRQKELRVREHNPRLGTQTCPQKLSSMVSWGCSDHSLHTQISQIKSFSPPKFLCFPHTNSTRSALIWGLELPSMSILHPLESEGTYLFPWPHHGCLCPILCKPSGDKSPRLFCGVIMMSHQVWLFGVLGDHKSYVDGKLIYGTIKHIIDGEDTRI